MTENRSDPLEHAPAETSYPDGGATRTGRCPTRARPDIFLATKPASCSYVLVSVYYYLTRNSDPFVKEGRKITEAEWRAAVANVPDLAIDVPEHSGPRGASIGVWAVWRSYPGGYPAWFVLLPDGIVEVKGMDKVLFGKFKQLASALGARMFCETGEEFR